MLGHTFMPWLIPQLRIQSLKNKPPEGFAWQNFACRPASIDAGRQNGSVWKNLNFGGSIRNLWSEIVGNLLFLLYEMVVLFISNIIQNCVYPYYNQSQCWMIAIFIFFLWKMAKLFFLVKKVAWYNCKMLLDCNC